MERIGKIIKVMEEVAKESTAVHVAKGQFNRSDFLKLASSVTLTTLAACTTGNRLTPSTLTPTPDQGTPTELSPNTAVGELSEVTDLTEWGNIVNSLPKDHPEAAGGDQSIDVIKIKIGGKDFYSAIYNLSNDAADNTVPIRLEDASGNITNVYEKVAFYTQYTDKDGNTDWKRLIAIPALERDQDGNPTGEVKMSWVFDQKGYPTEPNQKIDLSHGVLAYYVPPKDGYKIQYVPLVADISLVPGWDGKGPITVNTVGNTPGGMKVLAATMPSGGIGESTSAESTATPESPEVAKTVDQLKISQDLEHPDKLQTADFEIFTDKNEEFAKWVMEQDAQGKFPDFPDTAKPVSTIQLGHNLKQIERGGLMQMYKLSAKDSSNNHYDIIKNRPYHLAAIWQAEYQGDLAYFALIEWLNPDGTHGFWGYLYKPLDTNQVDADLKTYFQENNPAVSLVPWYISGEKGTWTGKNALECMVTPECLLYRDKHSRYGGSIEDPIYQKYLGIINKDPNITYPKDTILKEWEKTGNLINHGIIPVSIPTFISIGPGSI